MRLVPCPLSAGQSNRWSAFLPPQPLRTKRRPFRAKCNTADIGIMPDRENPEPASSPAGEDCQPGAGRVAGTRFKTAGSAGSRSPHARSQHARRGGNQGRSSPDARSMRITAKPEIPETPAPCHRLESAFGDIRRRPHARPKRPGHVVLAMSSSPGFASAARQNPCGRRPGVRRLLSLPPPRSRR